MWPFSKAPGPIEAVLGLLSAAVAADGAVDPAETERLNEIFRRLGLDRGLSAEEFATMRVRVNDALRQARNPRQAIAHYAGHVPREHRGACYALCLELIMADARIDALEADFLGHLRSQLGLEEATAQKIWHALQSGSRLQGIDRGDLRFA